MNLLSQKKRNGRFHQQTKNYKRNKSKKLKSRQRSYQLKGGAKLNQELGTALNEAFFTALESRRNFFHPHLDDPRIFETDYNITTEYVTKQARFTAAGAGAIVPHQEGEQIGAVYQHLQIINNGMTETPYDSSVISFVDLRGVVIKDNFQKVPPNTMICFVSPLDNSVSPNFNRDSSLLYSILNMNNKQYTNLFQFRMGMRKNPLIIEKIGGKKLPMIYSNCLANSYWVYPGEIYPEMKFMVDTKAYNEDPDTEKCVYITLRMGADKVSRPVQNLDAVPREQLRQPIIQDIRLSNIVRCPSRDETIRLIMVLSSRNLEHRSQYSEVELRRLMNLELYNYEMNKVLERKILEGIDVLQQLNFEQHPISATCGYVDSEMERLTFFQEHSFTNMIHRTYNLNYHTMVPKLQDIYRQIPDVVKSSSVKAVGYKYVSFCQQSDAYFIGGLSPKIILSFLGKVLQGEGFPQDLKLEIRRISTFFRTISEGLALSMLKIYEYIQKSANFIQFFAESTIQKELYEVCHIIMKFLTENDVFLKDSFSYKLEESVKLFKKSKSFEALLKESIKKGDAVLPYLICDIPDELLQIEITQKINQDTTLEFKVSVLGLPPFSNLSKLGTLVLTSSTYRQSVKLDLTHQLLQLRSLVLVNLNLELTLNLKELYPNLQSLSISSCNISIGTLESIPLLTSLNKLTLEDLNLSAPMRMNFFDRLTNLKQLKISKLGAMIPMIYLNNISLEVVILEKVPSFVFDRSLKLKDLQISGLQYEEQYGFPSRLPNRVGNLILVNCENITPDNLVLPEGIKIDSLLLVSNTLELNTVNKILEKTKITKLEAKNNDFVSDILINQVGLGQNAFEFVKLLGSQTKLKNIYLVNNKFSQPARIAQPFLEPLKLDSLVIKHNENLTMDLKSIKVKAKKVLHN